MGLCHCGKHLANTDCSLNTDMTQAFVFMMFCHSHTFFPFPFYFFSSFSQSVSFVSSPILSLISITFLFPPITSISFHSLLPLSPLFFWFLFLSTFLSSYSLLFTLMDFYYIHSRVPGSTTSTSSPLPPAPAAAPNPEPSPHSWMTAAGDSGRLSSDEGDAETPEDTDRPGFHYSSHHPQPLGVNSMTTNVAFGGTLAVHNLGGPI